MLILYEVPLILCTNLYYIILLIALPNGCVRSTIIFIGLNNFLVFIIDTFFFLYNRHLFCPYKKYFTINILIIFFSPFFTLTKITETKKIKS